MRKILTILGIVLAIAIVVPVLADYSQYVWPPPNSWTVSAGQPAGWNGVEVYKRSEAYRWWIHIRFKNIGSIPLTEAIITTRIWKIRLVGADGIGGNSDDVILTWPTFAVANQYVQLLNTQETLFDKSGFYKGWWVVSLGTIQPERSHNKLFNWWTSSEVCTWTYYVAVWYLP